jgi:tetratricopeptide (TPR) repeat protein
LALATAGAFLKQTQLTFVEYLYQYDSKWKVSNRRLRALPEYSDRTLYTTWMISFDQIEKEDRQVAQLLMLLAYFDNQNVSYKLLHAGTSKSSPAWLIELTNEPGDFADAMSVLSEYCLVETRPGTHSYSIHVCVHDWLLNGIDSTLKEREQRYSIAFDCTANSIDCNDWDILSGVQYNRIAAHALRLGHMRFISLLSNNDFTAGRTDRIHNVGELLRKQGHHDRAELMYLRALAGKKKALGPDHTATLETVNNLGTLYGDQGRLAEAEQMYLRALAGNEKALGPDHTSTLDTVNNLGILYRGQGRLAEAEQTYLRALAGKEKALGPDHTSTLHTVNNLGILYGAQGRLAEAEQTYLRALAGYEKALGPDHTSTLETVNNLRVLYGAQGRLAEAEQMYLRALRHPYTPEVANDLKQLNVEVMRNENHDSSVDQSLQKRKNGKGKWWQWKGRKTGNSSS